MLFENWWTNRTCFAKALAPTQKSHRFLIAQLVFLSYFSDYDFRCEEIQRRAGRTRLIETGPVLSNQFSKSITTLRDGFMP